jgi:acetone carboxylase gamma subunit
LKAVVIASSRKDTTEWMALRHEICPECLGVDRIHGIFAFFETAVRANELLAKILVQVLIETSFQHS